MRKGVFVALILAFAGAVLLSLTQHAHATSVYAAREDGTMADTFAMGEKVRIIAYSTDAPYNIEIIDSENVIRYTILSETPSYDGLFDDITDKPGSWEVKAGTTSTRYAIAFYNVIPEVPLGTLSILITFFAAFGISMFRKRNKPKFTM